MARRADFITNAYYHVYNRGANRERIFREERNYHFLLKRIKEFSAIHHIGIIAYCMLPNHYHLLVRQEAEVKVSVFMQAVFNSYTKAFNHAYSRTGTLFEGPFKAIRIEKYSHLLQLCLYIHHNPVHAGLAYHPIDWPFSNYSAFVRRKDEMLCDSKFLEDNFPDPAEYEKLIREYKPLKRKVRRTFKVRRTLVYK
jgi:putative transposase